MYYGAISIKYRLFSHRVLYFFLAFSGHEIKCKKTFLAARSKYFIWRTQSDTCKYICSPMRILSQADQKEFNPVRLSQSCTWIIPFSPLGDYESYFRGPSGLEFVFTETCFFPLVWSTTLFFFFHSVFVLVKRLNYSDAENGNALPLVLQFLFYFKVKSQR